MFFDPLYEGSAGLSYVKLVAVPARNFVDNIFKTGRGVFDLVCDSRDLRLTEEWKEVLMS